MGTRNIDFFWQHVNIVIVIVFGCIATSLSELVARGQLINERLALTGDCGCCIIEPLVRPHNSSSSSTTTTTTTTVVVV